jgi:hypothetical protein
MKKTNVLISFFAKGKTLWVSLALIGAFFLMGISTASAQLVPKNATPLQKMQAEYNWLVTNVDPLPPSDPYHATFAPYKAWLAAMINDMTILGMSYHSAFVKNRPIIPQAPYPVSLGIEGSAVLKKSPKSSLVHVK